MTMISFPNTSPYKSTPQTTWYTSFWEQRNIPPDRGDRSLVIDSKYQYRPDLLSIELYGTAAYFWVFSVKNLDTIRDPIWDFTTGKTIIVPSREHIERVLAA